MADSSNNRIQKIAGSGAVSTLAGRSGSFGAQDGSSDVATFNRPQGIAVDQAGKVYVADSNSGLLRVITSAGVVSTLHPTFIADPTVTLGNWNDQFYTPEALAVDGQGNLFATWRWMPRGMFMSAILAIM